MHFEASQHICRCPPSVLVLFNPYPKGAGGKTSNDSICIVPLSLSPKQFGVCQKREDSLSVSAATSSSKGGWAVNFYRRIHFQYTHFSPMSNQYAKFHIPAIWFQPIQDSIMQMFIMRRYDSNPVEIPEALLATQNEPFSFLSSQSTTSSNFGQIITLQMLLDLPFVQHLLKLILAHHSLPRAKREFICKIFIHKQLRWAGIRVFQKTFFQEN